MWTSNERGKNKSHGQEMNKINNLWTNFEQVMTKQWTFHDQVMHKLKVLRNEQAMNKQVMKNKLKEWTKHAKVVKSHELFMNKFRTSVEKRTNNSWRSCEQGMKNT